MVEKENCKKEGWRNRQKAGTMGVVGSLDLNPKAMRDI